MNKYKISSDKNKLVIFSSDTPHHRYFINQILDNGYEIECIFFETKYSTPAFKVGPLFEEKETEFEKRNFFRSTAYKINSRNIIQVSNINDNKVFEEIKRIKPSLGIVFGTGKVKDHILDLFEGRLLNIHRGIPQKYRGLDSDLWAIYNNDYENIGTTIHRVDSNLDTGDYIYQERMKLSKEMKIFQIRYYTTLIASEITLLTLGDYHKDQLEFFKQESLGKYYSFMPYNLKVESQIKFNNYCKAIM